MKPTGAVAFSFLLSATACGRLSSLTSTTLSSSEHESAAAAPAAATAPSGVPAFRGAEGFGASARGGRGGSVCRVTSLARDGAGTLQACFDAKGPRTVVFDVSGVIEGPLEIKHGLLTVAGQTSPSGITVKGGVVCDNVYDANDCNDVVVRHVRFRGGAPDSFRIGGAHHIILDHCSFASAEDENVEITRSRDITIQYAVIAEPRGDHYRWGGVLINYSKDVMPLDRITIHHSVWNGVAGRLPEISCEDNADGPGKSSCAGRTIAVELTNNVLWDASDPIWFNRCTGSNQGNDCAPGSRESFALRLNLVGNVLARRAGAGDAPFAEPALFAPTNDVHAADNALVHGSVRTPVSGGTTARRHPFPAVTVTPSTALVATLARTAGAFPRDAMDERLASYLTRSVDQRPAAWRDDKGVDVGDSFGGRAASTAAAPLPDGDGDGMPDAWERTHRLDPAKGDGAVSGVATGCAATTTALECYLDELADGRVPR